MPVSIIQGLIAIVKKVNNDQCITSACNQTAPAPGALVNMIFAKYRVARLPNQARNKP